MNSEPQESGTDKIKYFFHPESIAIVGASANMAKLSGRPIAALLKKKFAGSIYPINPRYDMIAGLVCYPSVKAVPGDIDLAVIALPIEGTLDALKACAEKDVKAAVVFTSGFAEVGAEGKALQIEISSLARRSGMRILGPNCLGLVYFKNSVMASFSDTMEFEIGNSGSLGFITQSGAYGERTVMQAVQDGVGFGTFVSVGNEADLQFSDFIDYLAGDNGTDLMGVYLEGAKDGNKFRKAAESALYSGKPILVKKVGRTGAGTRAAASHTGALAGNDSIYEAFFRQMGIIRINELRDLTFFAIAYKSGRMPKGRKVAILTDSGGPGVEMADKCEEFGLIVPELSGTTKARIQACLPFYGSARNPVDMTAAVMTDQKLFGECLRAIFDDESIDIVFAPGFFMAYTEPGLLNEIIDIYRSSSKPLVFFPVWVDDSPQAADMIARIKKEGIPVIPEATDAARTMSSLVWYCEKRQRAELKDCRIPHSPEKSVDIVKKILGKSKNITEYDGKRILAAYGIPVTNEQIAGSEEEAVKISRKIGFPVALKIQSHDIPHKTEAGGIMLNLKTEAEVRESYNALMKRVKEYAPQSEVSGVLVQEMVTGGVEVIVGITRDPVFGPCVMFGLGGIYVEAMHDVSFRIPPISMHDAEEMIEEIKGAGVLKGIRGKPASDTKALVDVIMQVSKLAVEFADQIGELDINPLIVLPEGARVVDALVVKR
ncbi:MAG: acetate--CoA ligase family protein [Syntrophales bacterium]|jgi:acetyltransferase|nr:acetate--CoA ligase family protein [Syntrophales bacterium]MDY0045677.1 acetate--CoA ligase family protein [Syntrophales bacterium]